ncbi:MAG: transcriptional repressor [Eubacterium sp.]|nr:transcriptional repressor [Eubacterium sp.]
MKNVYKTKARECILSYLKEHREKRFTAREIYDYLKNQVEGVNRTTVYRNLDRLCDQGDLLRFKEPNQDAWYYQYSEEHKHCDKHMHAQCSECGKIFHLENSFVDEFEEKLHSVYGLDINSSKTIIIGKCDECSKLSDGDHEHDQSGEECHEHEHDQSGEECHDHDHEHDGGHSHEE